MCPGDGAPLDEPRAGRAYADTDGGVELYESGEDEEAGGGGPAGATAATVGRVEERARALIVTEGPLSRPVPVALRYDPDDEPGVVLLGFPGGAEWVLPRALLEDGLRAPAHSGEVDVWPCGRVQTVVEHHSTDGTEIAQFDSAALLRFLRRTYAATASPMTR